MIGDRDRRPFGKAARLQQENKRQREEWTTIRSECEMLSGFIAKIET
jgi:hypothetical protein